MNNLLKDQQVHFGVILLHSGHQHVEATFIYLFSIPEIHQSGYRTCHYITIGRVYIVAICEYDTLLTECIK
jgi:hypothetical protein